MIMASIPCDLRGCHRIAQCALFGTLIACAGCTFHHGPREDRIGSFVPPAGVSVEVRLHEGDDGRKQEITGELLAVQDDGMLLLTDRIVLIPFEAAERVRSGEHPLGRRVTWGMAPEEIAEALRPASRYPNGIHSTVLARMLATLNQPDVVRVAP